MKAQKKHTIGFVLLTLSLVVVLLAACSTAAPASPSAATTAAAKPATTAAAPATTAAAPATSAAAPATSAAAPATSAAAPATSAAAAKPGPIGPAIKLKVGHYFTETDARGRVMAEWLRQATEATGGQITGQVYANGLIAKGTEMFGATRDGLADVGTITVSYIQGDLPELGIFVIPPVSPNFDKTVIPTFMSLWDRIDGQMQKQGVKLLGVFMDASKYSFFFKNPITNVNDTKGRKVRTAGGKEDNAVFEKLSMIPISMGAGEQYQALQTGVIDGAGTAAGSYLEYKLYEVAPYAMWVNFKFPPYLIFMDLDTWKKLSPEQQAALNKVRDSLGKYAEDLRNKETADVIAECNKLAKGQYTPPDAEADAWMNKALVVREEWIKQVGPDTSKLYLDAFEKVTGFKWRP